MFDAPSGKSGPARRRSLFRTGLDRFLARTRGDRPMVLRYPDGSETRVGGAEGEPCRLTIHDWATLRQLCLNPELTFGEAYMDRRLSIPEADLLDVLRRLMSMLWRDERPTFAASIHAHLAIALRRLNQLNTARRARRHAEHHYSIGLDLYRLMLDPDLQYSCAYFRTGSETLAEAQEAKKRHIAAKLLLDRPGLRLLDIGCGWGGLALSLARDYGAEVTGITLSQAQLDHARARAEAEGLAKRARFELLDYRKIPFTFDRIVSVGMFEHVGLNHFRDYFETVERCLEPDGVALIHAIGRSFGPGATNAWVRRYIFPGGYVPALSEVMPHVERAGLMATDIEILRLHYASTLAKWRENLRAHRAEIVAARDERFFRMFEFYLAGAEVTFRDGGFMVWHLQLARQHGAVPLTRDYIAE